MFFADFETTTKIVDENKSWVWLWGIKGAIKGDLMEWGLSIDSFMNHLVVKNKTDVYFHNLSFDGNYIYKWLLYNDYKFININNDLDYKLKKKEWSWICNEQGRIYRLDVMHKGVVITFQDSWLVLMSSVADLGSSINFDKLTMDYDTYYTKREEVPDDVIKYLERDIDVVIKTFTHVTSIYDKQMTRASMSYENFREYYGELDFSYDFGGKKWNYKKRIMEYRNILSRKDWLVIFRSYQGGYTNWNQKYTNKVIKCKNGISLDIHSSYPGVFINEKYPYGQVYYSKPVGDYVELITVNIISAIIKDHKYPAIIKDRSRKVDAKYLKELYNEERVYWREEFEFIKKYYDVDYRIVTQRYFKSKYVFRDWMLHMQDLKIKAPNKVERNFHKGIFNSLYGKFGQNIFMGSRIIVPYDVPIEKRNKRKTAYGKNDQFTHEAVFNESENRKYIPVASFTTMKGRLNLFKAMFDNLDIWIYSDTDSCYFTQRPKNLKIHPTKLGSWGYEHKFTKIKVLRAKCYMYDSTHEYDNGEWIEKNETVKKISGVSKSGKESINWNNFKLGSVIKDGKTGSVNVKGGKHIIKKDFTLGKSISGENVIIDTYKKLLSYEDKKGKNA